MPEADRDFTGQDRSTVTGRASLQAWLASIINSSDDGIVSKDLNGIVQSWNEAAERIFGYTAGEIVGQSITTIIPSDRQHEEREILESLRRGERVDHFQTVRRRKDGRLIPVSVTISPVQDADGRVVAASKIIRDLSASSELEGRFKAIIDSSDDAIVSKDLNGIVRSWNPGAELIFGYTAAEMIGRSIEVLFPPDRKDEEPRILQRLRRGERVDHFETVRVRKDGTLIDVSVTISPVLSPTGEVIGASKIARDVTAYKQLLRQREELLESERHARQEAERVSRVKDEFLATLSHELRTPLNAILGWAQVLRQRVAGAAGGATGGDLCDELVEGLEVIERNTRVQTQLIDDLLDMSRITAGKIRLDVQQVDLADVVKAAVASVRHAAEGRRIRLQVVLDPLAGPVRGDPSRLQQCVWNLLTNAVKFTPKGGTVQVGLERVNSHLEVCVSDNGEGIKPELLPHLFERFRQGDASTTRRHGGLGLGLSIVKHLIELHGGKVRAKSPGPGQGATFCIDLPLMVVHPPQGEAHRTHPRSASPAGGDWIDHPSLDGITVLAVDDEPDALALVKRVLEGCGAKVLTAGSAREGLDLVAAERPDVIVSDIGMPDEDGYDFIRKVRALPAAHGGRTPAAALTAFARAEDRTRALRAGYQTHVAKPVESSELTAVVASLASTR